MKNPWGELTVHERITGNADLIETPVDLGFCTYVTGIKVSVDTMDPNVQLEIMDDSAVEPVIFYTNDAQAEQGSNMPFGYPGRKTVISGRKIIAKFTPNNANSVVHIDITYYYKPGQSVQLVQLASTADVDLTTGLIVGQSIDGVVLALGDLVLLKDQTAGEENGVYQAVSSGAGVRYGRMRKPAQFTAFGTVVVVEGGSQANQEFTQTAPGAIVVDTTALTYERTDN